jgi:hypothetical protein
VTENEIHEQVAALVVRRQELRAQGAPRGELEDNRIELLRAQWDLSLAFIARNVPAARAVA